MLVETNWFDQTISFNGWSSSTRLNKLLCIQHYYFWNALYCFYLVMQTIRYVNFQLLDLFQLSLHFINNFYFLFSMFIYYFQDHCVAFVYHCEVSYYSFILFQINFERLLLLISVSADYFQPEMSVKPFFYFNSYFASFLLHNIDSVFSEIYSIGTIG